MRHRGPDQAGEYFCDQARVGLCMSRLSILDLAHGSQPMSDEDASLTLVFNGEIFNAPDLRRELVDSGARFMTDHSDTEVILRGYQQHGPDFVKRLRGMFAFVIHDRKRQILFGARDPLGIKPLHYFQSGQHFAFASEIKTLFQSPKIERSEDEQSIWNYLTLLYVPGDRTAFRGIFRLPAGTCLTYRLNNHQLDIRRYWSPRIEATGPARKKDAAVELRDRARKAVSRWSLSDVPLGCSLSGGVDSAAVVGLLRESGCNDIKTYTLGFEGAEELDERDAARKVAERWGTEHHEFIARPDDLLDHLIDMVWALDEPYGGGLPSWFVFQQMSPDLKVGLTGTGGDELFGNYGKFRIYEHGFFNRLKTFGDGGRWLSASLGGDGKFGKHYHAVRRYHDDALKKSSLWTGSSQPATEAYIQQVYDSYPYPTLRDRLMIFDIEHQLTDEFLLMTDRFSMAHSLEARVPLLDQDLVGWVFSLPPEIRTRRREPKDLLKTAMADLLPEAALRGPKQGFVLPLDQWLRRPLQPLLQTLLRPEALKEISWMRNDYHRSVVEPFLRGETHGGQKIWSVLMLMLWRKVFIELSPAEKPTLHWKDLL